MVLHEVFSYSLRIRFKASLCSKTTLFYFLTTILTFILPLICIYSEGFWKTVDHFREQPDVLFKHKMLLLLETRDLDNYVFWSTYKKLNEFVPQKFQEVIPTIEHREEDYNRDGIYDELLMTIDIPLLKQEVLSLKLLLIFDYKLQLYSKFQMECAAYVYHSSSLPGSSVHIFGDLFLSQREPLSYSGTDGRFNFSIIDESKHDVSYLKLENIFMQYIKRNVTASLLNQYLVWKSGHAENTSFVVNLHIKYPEQTFLYNVPLWQLLKLFIVQYIAFYIIFYFIFQKIKLYVFKKQLLPCIAILPMKQD